MCGQSETQLDSDQRQFDLVIFCNKDNERYYDRAYDAAMGQRLPFAHIHRVQESGHAAADWMKVELGAKWVFRINADIALYDDATLKILPNLADDSVGVIRCGTKNALIGELFEDLQGTPDLLIFKTAAVRQALQFAGVQTFDLMPLIQLAKFSRTLLRSKTREFDRERPGYAAAPVTKLVQLGENIADWSTTYAFKWCYRLGAQMHSDGAKSIDAVIKSMMESAHEHWQLGLAAYIQGFLAGAKPTDLVNDGALVQLAQAAEILGGKKAPTQKRRMKIL